MRAVPLLLAATLVISADAYGQSGGAPWIGGDGDVAFAADTQSEIIALSTRLVVPQEPERFGTLFVWPGLQPGGANYDPIGNGVLQSVLTWGPSCVDEAKPADYATWWISAQYVNTQGKPPGGKACNGGPVMAVRPTDALDIRMALAGSTWTQTVRNLRTGERVAYSMDLRGQAQTYLYFSIEPDRQGAPYVDDVVFTNTIVEFKQAHPANCQLIQHGRGDIVTRPIPSAGGRACSIKKIVLKSAVRETVRDPSCRKEGAVKSLPATDAVTIAFVNAHTAPIRLYWLDYDGRREMGETIEIGNRLERSTFVKHPWLVADLTDACMGVYLPSKKPGVHVVR